MEKRTLPALHPAGIALGAFLTGIGLIFAELFLGPLLARTMAPAEERVVGQVLETIEENYVVPKERDWLMRQAIKGMVDGLNDPYSYFVGPEQMIGLEEESSGHLIGIGVILDGGDQHYVRYPVPNGPAQKAGLQPGDRILSVDGVRADDFDMSELIAKIKGEEGTSVALEMERLDGDRYTAEVVRASIPKGTVAKTRILDTDHGIGIVHIRSFARSTVAELDRALEQLEKEGLRALILDLRFNTGGLLKAAEMAAARFLDGGVICTLQDQNGDVEVRQADPANSRLPHLPIVVLVNKYSASGSEVLAGALRDHGAAILLGERTYGKGVYQKVIRHPDLNFAYKFTAGFYVTPGGKILEGHITEERAGGLEPDVSIDMGTASINSLLDWLSYDPPPEIYLELVKQLYPNALMQPPTDPMLNAAVDLLRLTLTDA